MEIAKISDGSFRDAAKYLEEISVYAGNKTVTADLVNEKFNSLGIGENIEQMIEIFVQKDVNKGLELCRELVKQGMDFRFFIEQLTNKLHLTLLQKAGIEKSEKEISLSLLEIRKLFELLATAYGETKTAVLPQMPLELMIMEWGEERGALRSSDESSNASVPAKLGIRSPAATLTKTSFRQTTPRADENIGFFADGSASAINSGKNSFFEKLINEVKLENHLIAGVLRSCSAEEVKNGILNIIAKSKFHKEKLEELKTLKLLENSADKILGEKINIKIILQGVINK